MEDNQILKSFSRVKSSLKIVLLTKLLFVFTWIHWLKSASPYSLQQSIEKSIGWNVVWKYVAKSKRNLSSFLHSSNIFSCIFSRWWLFIFKVISAICELRYRYTFKVYVPKRQASLSVCTVRTYLVTVLLGQFSSQKSCMLFVQCLVIFCWDLLAPKLGFAAESVNGHSENSYSCSMKACGTSLLLPAKALFSREKLLGGCLQRLRARNIFLNATKMAVLRSYF